MSSLCTRGKSHSGFRKCTIESYSPFVQYISNVIKHWVDHWGTANNAFGAFQISSLISAFWGPVAVAWIHSSLLPPTRLKEGWWSELLQKASHGDQCLCWQLLQFLILMCFAKSLLCRQYNCYLTNISLGLGKCHLKERKVLISIGNWLNSHNVGVNKSYSEFIFPLLYSVK